MKGSYRLNLSVMPSGCSFVLKILDADVHNQCLYGNDVYLLANVSEQRKIVLTTMTDIENDMAEIRFVDCGKRMMTLRFVREL